MTIKFIDDTELFRPERAAGYLGVGLPTLRSWVKQFQIPKIVIRGHTRYRRADLDKFIDAHVQRPGAHSND